MGPFVHPAFAPYRRWLRGTTPPDLLLLNQWADATGLALPDGRPLHFVEAHEQRALAYETAVFRDARIEVREDCWHDAFNALVWLAFPRTKAALNARHLRDGVASRPNARSPGRDAATQLDESGMIIVSADASLVQQLRDHDWRSLFVDRRDEVADGMHALAIGHGLLAKLMKPFRAITAKVLWLPADPGAGQRALPQVDGCASACVTQWPALPPRLLPLPVAALPGWDAEGLGERLFDDVSVFRPPRATLPTQ